MKCNRRVLNWALAVWLLLPCIPLISQQAERQSSQISKEKNEKPIDRGRLRHPLLWHDPGRIADLNLLYGLGGREGQPLSPFNFESEDASGTNPKFDVRDAHGTKWRVKLGDEARPEVTASRLLWAVGYFVDDDYLVTSARIENLNLTRGAIMASDGTIVDARFEKKPDGRKKIGIWKWKENPFTGTREFNGLRTMMAVMNNWDLKDVNNAVYEDTESDSDLFLTSDVGATFGTNGLSWSKGRSKGDVGTFEKSKFITRRTASEVDFGTPAAPLFLEAANVKKYSMRRDLEWIGRKIPIADARWIGSLMKQLSHQQLLDAFRAGDFPQEDAEKYVDILESRIRELASL
ncbi:MAG TPA: hypothetical protein VN753_13720 [Terracidiphilus sp.]|nr:hypothetical protein [Terracidiphilus sp.]